jgi:hypothetical protein
MIQAHGKIEELNLINPITKSIIQKRVITALKQGRSPRKGMIKLAMKIRVRYKF